MWRGKDACEGGGQWCEGREVRASGANWLKGGQPTYSLDHPNVWRPRMRGRRFFCCPWCSCFESEPVIYRVQDAGGGGWGETNDGAAWQVRVSLFSAPALATARCSGGQQEREREGTSDGDRLGGGREKESLDQVTRLYEGEGTHQGESACSHGQHPVEHQLTLHISAERVEAGTPVPPPVSQSPPLVYESFDDNADGGAFCDRVRDVPGDLPPHFQRSSTKWSRCLLGCCGGVVAPRRCRDGRCVHSRRRGCLRCPKKSLDGCSPSLWKHRGGVREQAGQETVGMNGESREVTGEVKEGTHAHGGSQERGQLCKTREGHTSLSPTGSASLCGEDREDCCPDGAFHKEQTVPPEVESGSLTGESRSLSSHFAAKGSERRCRSRNSVVSFAADDVNDGNVEGKVGGRSGTEGGAGDLSGYSSASLRASSSSSNMNASASSPCCCGLGGRGSAWNSPVRRRGRSFGAVSTLETGGGYPCPEKKGGDGARSPASPPELYVHWGVCIDSPTEWRTPPERLVSSESFLDRASHAVRTPFVKLTKSDARSVPQEDPRISREPQERQRHSCKEGEPSSFEEELTSCDCVFVNESTGGGHVREKGGGTKQVMEGSMVKEGLDRSSVVREEVKEGGTRSQDTNSGGNCVCLLDSSHTGKQDGEEWESAEERAGAEQRQHSFECDCFPNFSDNAVRPFPSLACPICFSSSPPPWVADSASSSSSSSSPSQSPCPGVSPATIYCMQLPLGTTTGSHADTPQGIQFVLFSPPGRWIKPRDDSNFVFNIYQAIGHIQLRIASFFLRRVLLCSPPLYHSSSSACSFIKKSKKERGPATGEHKDKTISRSPRPNLAVRRQEEDSVSACSAAPLAPCELSDSDLAAACLSWKEKGESTYLRGVARRRSFPLVSSRSAHRGCSFPSCFQSYVSTSRLSTRAAQSRRRVLSPPLHGASSDPSLLSSYKAAEESSSSSCSPCSSSLPLSESRHAIRTWAWSLPKRFCDASSRKETTKEGAMTAETSCAALAERTVAADPVSISLNEVFSSSPSEVWSSNLSSLSFSPPVYREGTATGPRCLSDPVLSRSDMTSTQFPSSQLSSSRLSSLHSCSPDNAGITSAFHTSSGGKVQSLPSSSSLPWLSTSPTPSPLPTSRHSQRLSHHSGATGLPSQNWRLEHAAVREFAVSEAGCFPPHKSSELCLSAACFVRWGDLSSQRCSFFVKSRVFPGEEGDSHQVDPSQELLCLQAILSYDKLPTSSGRSREGGRGGGEETCRVVWGNVSGPAQRRGHRKGAVEEGLGVLRSFESPQQACSAAEENKTINERSSQQTNGSLTSKTLSASHVEGRQRGLEKSQDEVMQGRYSGYCGTGFEARRTKEEVRDAYMDKLKTREDYEEEKTTTSCVLTIGQPGASWESAKQELQCCQSPERGWKGGTLDEQSLGNEDKQKAMKCGPTLRELCNGVAYPLFYGCRRYADHGITGENKGREKENEDWLEKSLRCEACLHLGSHCHCESISLDSPLDFLAVSRRTFLLGSSRPPTLFRGRKSQHLHPFSSSFSPASKVRRRSTPDGGLSLDDAFKRKRRSSELSCPSSEGGESLSLHDGGVQGQSTQYRPVVQLYLTTGSESEKGEVEGPLLILTSLPLPGAIPIRSANVESLSSSSSFVFSVSRDEGQHSTSSTHKRRLPFLLRLRSRTTKSGDEGKEEGTATDSFERTDEDADEAFVFENDFAEEEPATGTCVNISRRVYSCESWNTWGKTPGLVEGSITSEARQTEVAFSSLPCEEQQDLESHIQDSVECQGGAGDHDITRLPIPLSPSSPSGSSSHRSSSRSCRRSPLLLGHSFEENNVDTIGKEIHGDSLFSVALGHHGDNPNVLGEEGTDRDRICFAPWKAECGEFEQQAALEEEDTKETFEICAGNAQFDNDEGGSSLLSPSPAPVETDKDEMLGDDGEVGEDFFASRQQGAGGHEKEDYEANSWSKARNEREPFDLAEVGRVSGRTAVEKKGGGREGEGERFREAFTSHRQKREGEQNERKKSLFSRGLRRLVKRFLRERLPPVAPTTSLSFAGRRVIDIKRFQVTGEDDGREGSSPSSSSTDDDRHRGGTPLPAGGGEAEVAILEEPSVTGKSPYFLLRISVLLWEDNSSVLPRGPVSSSSSQLSAKGGCSFPSSSPSSLASASAFSPSEEKSFYAPSRVTENGLHCKAGGTGQSLDSQERSPHMNHIHSDSEGTHTSPVGVVDNHNLGGSSGCPSPPANGSSCFPYTTTSSSSVLWCHWGLHLAEETPAPERARRIVRDALATIAGLAVFPAFASSHGVGNFFQPSCMGPFHTCGHSSIPIDFLHNISHVLSTMAPPSPKSCRTVSCTSRREEDCGSCSQPPFGTGTIPQAFGERCDHPTTLLPRENEEITRPGASQEGGTHDGQWCAERKPTRGEGERRGCIGREEPEQGGYLSPDKTKNEDVSYFAWVQAPRHVWPEGSMPGDAASVDTPMKQVLVNERRTWLHYFSKRLQHRVRGSTAAEDQGNVTQGTEAGTEGERQQNNENSSSKDRSASHLSASDRQCSYSSCAGRGRDTSPFSSDSSSSDSGEDHCRIRLFSLDRGPGRNERREVDGEKTEAMMMLKGGGHVVQAETGSFSSAERDSGNEEDESSMALLKLHVLDLRLPTRVNGKKVTGFSFVLRSGPPAPCRWFHQRIMGASAGGCSSSGLEEPRRGDFFVACERPRFHDFQQPQGIFSLSAISQQLHYLRQQFMYLLTSPPPLSIKSSLSFGLQATMLTARKGETTSATAAEGKYHTQHVLSAATAALLLHSPPAPSLFQQQRVIEMLVDASTFLNPPGLPSASLRPSLGQDRVIFRESLLKTKRDGHDNTAKEPHQVDPSDAIEGTPPNEDVCMAKSSRVQEASGCCQGHDGATCGGDGELHRQQRQGGDQDSSASFDLSRANDGRGGSASPASCDEAASLSQANVLGSASRHRDNGVPKGCWSGDGENDDRHLLPPGFCFPSVSPIPSSPAYLSSNSMKRDCFCPVCFERGGEDKAFFSSSSTSSTIVQCVVTILRLLEGGDQRTEDVGFWSWIFAFALLERFQWTQQQTMKYTKMFEKERTRADMEIAMKMKISNRRQHVGNPSGQNAAHHPLNGSDTSEPSVNVKEREAKASLTPKGGSFKNEESEGCQHQETEKEKTEEGEKEGQQKNVRKGQALSGHVLGEKNSLQVKRQETNKTVNSGSEVVSHQVPHSQDAHSSHPPSYTSSTQVNCASVTPQRRRSPSSEQNDGGSQRKNHTTMKRGSSNPSASTASQEMNIDCDSSMRDHLGSRHFLSPPLSSSSLPRALYHGTPQPRVPTQHPRVYFLCTPVIPPSALWLGERLLLLLTRFWREAVKCRPIIRMLIAVFAAPLVAGRILDELVRILHASRLAEREIFFRQWASRLRHNPSPLVDYLISPSSGFPSFASSFCNVNLDRAFSRTPQCSPWCRMNKSGTSPLVCDRQAEGSARNVERSEERDVRPTSSTLMGIRCVDASGESGMLRASLWYVESGGRSRWFWRGLGVAQRDLERLLETEARSKGEVGGLGSKNEETQERTQQHQHTENNVGNKEKTVPRRNSEVEWGHGPTSLSATGEGGSTREVAARGDYGEGKKEEDEEGKVLFDSSVVVSSVEARETESVEKGRESDDLAHENKKHGGEGSNSTNENDRKQGELTSAKDVADAGLSKASHQAFSTSSPHVNDEDSSANVNNHLQQFLPSCWYEEDQAEPIIDTFPSDYTLWQSYSLPCLSEHRNDLLGMSLSPCSPLSVTFRPKSYSLGTLLENSTQFSSSSPFHRVPRRRADVGWLAYQSMGLIEEEEEQGKAGAEESGDRRHYLLEQRDDFSLYSQPVHELLPLQDQVDVSSGLRQCLASLWLLLRQPRLHLPSNFWSSGNTGESFLSPLEMMTNKKKMQEEEKEQELNQNAVRCGMVYSGLAGLPISVVFRFCCSETHKAFLPQELEELLHEIVKHRCLDFCACQDRSQSLETSSDYDDDAKGTTTSSCLPSCCPPHDSTVRTPLPMSSRRSSFSSSCEELFAEPRRRRRSLDPKGFNSDRGHCDCLWSYCSSHLSEYDTTKQDEDTCQLEASPLLPPALETYTPDRCKRGGNNVAIRLRCGRDLIAPSPPLSRWCDAATFPPPPPPLVATSQKSCSRTAPKEMTNKQRRKRCSARRTRDMGRSSSSFSASPEVKEKGKFSKRNLDKRADACGPNHHCTSLSFPQTEKGGTKSNSDEARTTQQGVVEGGKEQRRRKATTNCDHGGSHYQWKSANKSCDANGDDTQCRSSGYTDCCCASLFTVVGRARTSLLPALLHCTDDVNLSNLLLLDIALDELQQQMVSRLLGDYQDQLKSLQEYGGGGVFDEAGELFGCWPSQKETQRGRGKRENGKRSKGSHRRAATAFYEGEDEEQASVERSGEERSEVDDPTEETAATRPLKNTEVESPKESPRKQKGEKCDSEPGEPQNVTASAVPLSVCSVEEKGQESDAKEVSKVRRGPSHDVCDGVKEEEDDEWKREEKQGKKGKKKESKTNREISSSSSSSSGRTGSSKSSVSEGDSETPQKENEEKERLFSYPGGLESYHSPYPSPTKEKEESSLNSQCKVERRLRERLAQTLCWPPCVCALFPLLGRLLSGLVILHPWYEEVDALYNDWRFVMELYQHEVRDAEDKKVVMCQSKVLKERSEARKLFPSKTTCLSSTRGKKKNFSQRSPSLRGPAFRPPCSFLGDGERGRKKSQEKEERNSGEVHVSRRSFENVRSKENFPRGRRRRCSFEERGCGSSPQLTKKADKKRRSEEGGERRERPGTAPSFLLRKELPSSLLFLVAVLKRLERCIMRLVGLCDEYCRGKLAFFVEARGGSSSLSSDLIERCVETSVLHSLGLVLQQLSLSLCFYYPSLSSAVSFLPTSCSTAAAGAMVFLPSLSSADKIPPPPFPLILATSHFDEANDRLPPYARAILLCPSSGAFLRRVAAPVLLRRLECFLMQDMEGQGDAVRVTGHQGTREREQEKEDEVWNEWSREENDGDDDMVFEEQRQIPHSRQLAYEKGDRRWGRSGRTRRRWVRELYTEGDMADVFGGPCKEEDGVEDLGDASAPPLFENCELNSKGKDTSRREGTKDYERRKGGHVFHQTGAGVNGSLLQSVDPSWTLGELLIAAAAGTAASRLSSGSSSAWLSPLKFYSPCLTSRFVMRARAQHCMVAVHTDPAFFLKVLIDLIIQRKQQQVLICPSSSSSSKGLPASSSFFSAPTSRTTTLPTPTNMMTTMSCSSPALRAPPRIGLFSGEGGFKLKEAEERGGEKKGCSCVCHHRGRRGMGEDERDDEEEDRERGGEMSPKEKTEGGEFGGGGRRDDEVRDHQAGDAVGVKNSRRRKGERGELQEGREDGDTRGSDEEGRTQRRHGIYRWLRREEDTMRQLTERRLLGRCWSVCASLQRMRNQMKCLIPYQQGEDRLDKMQQHHKTTFSFLDSCHYHYAILVLLYLGSGFLSPAQIAEVIRGQRGDGGLTLFSPFHLDARRQRCRCCTRNTKIIPVCKPNSCTYTARQYCSCRNSFTPCRRLLLTSSSPSSLLLSYLLFLPHSFHFLLWVFFSSFFSPHEVLLIQRDVEVHSYLHGCALRLRSAPSLPNKTKELLQHLPLLLLISHPQLAPLLPVFCRRSEASSDRRRQSRRNSADEAAEVQALADAAAAAAAAGEVHTDEEEGVDDGGEREDEDYHNSSLVGGGSLNVTGAAPFHFSRMPQRSFFGGGRGDKEEGDHHSKLANAGHQLLSADRGHHERGASTSSPEENQQQNEVGSCERSNEGESVEKRCESDQEKFKDSSFVIDKEGGGLGGTLPGEQRASAAGAVASCLRLSAPLRSSRSRRELFFRERLLGSKPGDSAVPLLFRKRRLSPLDDRNPFPSIGRGREETSSAWSVSLSEHRSSKDDTSGMWFSTSTSTSGECDSLSPSGEDGEKEEDEGDDHDNDKPEDLDETDGVLNSNEKRRRKEKGRRRWRDSAGVRRCGCCRWGVRVSSHGRALRGTRKEELAYDNVEENKSMIVPLGRTHRDALLPGLFPSSSSRGRLFPSVLPSILSPPSSPLSFFFPALEKRHFPMSCSPSSSLSPSASAPVASLSLCVNTHHHPDTNNTATGTTSPSSFSPVIIEHARWGDPFRVPMRNSPIFPPLFEALGDSHSTDYLEGEADEEEKFEQAAAVAAAEAAAAALDAPPAAKDKAVAQARARSSRRLLRRCSRSRHRSQSAHAPYHASATAPPTQRLAGENMTNSGQFPYQQGAIGEEEEEGEGGGNEARMIDVVGHATEGGIRIDVLKSKDDGLTENGRRGEEAGGGVLRLTALSKRDDLVAQTAEIRDKEDANDGEKEQEEGQGEGGGAKEFEKSLRLGSVIKKAEDLIRSGRCERFRTTRSGLSQHYRYGNFSPTFSSPHQAGGKGGGGRWLVGVEGFQPHLVGPKGLGIAMLRQSPVERYLAATAAVPFDALERTLRHPVNRDIRRQLQHIVAALDIAGEMEQFRQTNAPAAAAIAARAATAVARAIGERPPDAASAASAVAGGETALLHTVVQLEKLLRRARQLIRVLHLPPEAFRDLHVFCSCPANNEKHDGETHSLMRGDGDFTDGGTGGCQNHDERLYRHPRPNSKQEWVGTRGGNGMEEEKESAHMRGDPGRGMITRDQDKIRKTTFDGQGAGATGNEEEKEGDQKDTRERTATDRKSPSNTGYRDVFVGGRGTQGNRGRRGVFLGDLAQEKKKTMWEQKQNKLKALLQQNPERLWSCVKNVWCTLFSPSVVLAVQRARLRFSQVRICVLLQLVEGVCEASFLCRTDVGNLCKRTLNSNGSPDQEGECHIRSSSSTHETEDDEYDTSCSSGRQRRGSNSSGGSCSSCSSYTGSSLVRHPTEPSSSSRYPCPLHEPKRRPSLRSCSSSRSSSSLADRQKGRMAINSSLGEGNFVEEEAAEPSPMHRCGTILFCREHDENLRKTYSGDTERRTNEMSAEEASSNRRTPVHQASQSTGRPRRRSGEKRHPSTECLDTLEDQSLSATQGPDHGDEDDQGSDVSSTDMNESFPHQKAAARKELYGEVVLGFCLAPRELIEGGSVGPGVPLLFRAEYTPPPDLSPSVWDERVSDDKDEEDRGGSFPSLSGMQDSVIVSPETEVYPSREGARKEEEGEIKGGDDLEFEIDRERVESKEQFTNEGLALETEESEDLDVGSPVEGKKHRVQASSPKDLVTHFTDTLLTESPRVPDERCETPEAKIDTSGLGDQRSPQPVPFTGNGSESSKEIDQGDVSSSFRWRKKSGALTARETVTEEASKKEEAPRRCASHPHHQPAVRFQIPPSSAAIEGDEGGQKDVSVRSDGLSQWKGYTGKAAFPLDGDRRKASSFSFAGDANSKLEPSFCPLCHCETVDPPGKGCSCMETPSGARISQPFVEGFPSKSTTLRFSRPCVLVSADLNVEGLESLMAVDGVIACVQQEIEEPNLRRPSGFSQNQMTTPPPSLRLIPSKSQQSRGDSAAVLGGVVRGGGSVPRDGIFYLAARPRGEVDDGTLPGGGAATPGLRVVGTAVPGGRRKGTPLGSGGASAPVVPAVGWLSYSGGMTPGGRAKTCFSGGERTGGLLLRPPGGVGDHRGVAIESGVVTPLTGGSIPRRHRLEYHREKWLMDSEWRERHLLEAAATAVEAERALGFPQIVCGMWVKPCIGDGNSSPAEEPEDGDNEALVVLSSRCVPVVEGCEEDSSLLGGSRTI